jgi:hypothetical protein
MALNPVDLATDLKAAFSTSNDPAIKQLIDSHYNQLAVIITNHILRAKVSGVTVNTSTGVQNNVAPVV